MSTIKLLGLTVAIALFAVHAAVAQEVDENAYKLVTYEVGDLVFDVPNYVSQVGQTTPSPIGDMGGGMGGGMFGRAYSGFGGEATSSGASGSTVAPVTVPALIGAIRTMVAPGTWRAQLGSGAGMGAEGMAPGIMGMEGGMGLVDPTGQPFGGQGEITSLGATLVVRQTKVVHREIAELLESLRGGSAARRSVAIDARWLMLTSDDLERLIPPSEDVAERPAVDRKALSEFTRRPDSLRGITNCFSGQSVYLTSGTRRSSVSSYIPVVGSLGIDSPAILAESSFRPKITFASERSTLPSRKRQRSDESSITLIADDQTMARALDVPRVGYQPIITTNNFGVELAIRPTLLQGEQAAVVDLKSTVTFPGQITDANAAADPALGAPLAPAVDRLAIQTQELATTVRVPLGQPVLVGGMTRLEQSTDPTFSGDGEQRQLYLIIEIK